MSGDMSGVDYYRLLGIHPTATRDEIKRAYRRLARRMHPDTNPAWEDNAEANRRMAELNEAYAVLRDPFKRTEYDLRRQRRLDETTRRARATTRAWTSRTAWTAQPRTKPTSGWPRLIFRPPVEQQVMLGFLAVAFLFVGTLGVSLAVEGLPILGALATLGGFMGSALTGMAVLPTFRGYIALTDDGLIEYPVFSLFSERVYRYDQICDVHWRAHRHTYGTSFRIMIDYFPMDNAGRVDTHRYTSKWLMRVDDPRALFEVLRRRATARKFSFSRPTWWAVVVGARELIGMMLAVFGFMLIAVLWGSVLS